MKNILVFILLSVFSFSVFSQNDEQKIEKIDLEIKTYNDKIDSLKKVKQNLQLETIHQKLLKYGLPKINKGEKLIDHTVLMLVYSEKHEQAKWVAHIISPYIIDGNVGRTNDFRPDPLVSTGSAVEKDYFIKYNEDGKVKYKGFGYDRGHLAPSADFKWSKTALSASYFYSNMSPQAPEFNRGEWATLEGVLRNYVYNNKVPLYVVTGPVLTDDLKPIPQSVDKVSIPNYFYKIAFDMKNQRAIGFIMPNRDLHKPLEYYAVSIDSVEKLTHIDFFASLNDTLENKIESQTDYKPFLPKSAKNDVKPLRILPKDCINSVQAWQYNNTGKKVTVCGTVVSTHVSKKKNVFINLDKAYPNQVFTIAIWSSNLINFSYAPQKYLENKKICVTGKVVDYKGVSSMYVNNEKQIEMLDEMY